MSISNFSLSLITGLAGAGFLGMLIIISRKLPELRKIEIPNKERKPFSVSAKDLLRSLAVRAKAEKFLEFSWWNILFQKALSQINILALKVERKAGDLLSKTREKARRKEESKAYWQKLSKFHLGLKKKKSENQ